MEGGIFFREGGGDGDVVRVLFVVCLIEVSSDCVSLNDGRITWGVVVGDSGEGWM